MNGVITIRRQSVICVLKASLKNFQIGYLLYKYYSDRECSYLKILFELKQDTYDRAFLPPCRYFVT